MSVELPFTNNSITAFTYEPFSYTISNPDAGLYTLSTTKTSGLPASYISNFGDSIVFETLSNNMVVGTQSFTITATDGGGNTFATSTNTVTTQVGRFVDSNGNSFTGSNYTFFAKEAITPIKMTAPFNIVQPTSTPSLPPGLSFTTVDMSSVFITGTPLVTAPQSNYLIIGKAVGSSKTISSTIGIVISNERISTTMTPDSVISNMTIGTPITPRILTAKGNGVIRYTWQAFPDGIVATDLSGNVQPFSSFGFTPTDPSYTMIIQGTPTLAAATSFKNAGYSNGVTQSILVERVSPLPLIANTIPIRFAFGETVLFDTTTIPILYSGVTLDPSANFFRAATYFTSNVPIASIVAPSLPIGLSLVFNGIDRAYLTGTPTASGSATYTIQATNTSGKTRDLFAPITVTTDSVVFTPTPPVVDLSFTFVLSRPLDLSLNGYYPTPITFTAAADSQRTLTWSAPGLVGTGLSLSATTGSSVSIVGTPTSVTPLQTIAITATAAGTLATASQNIKIEVINDVITLSTITAAQGTFIQNKTITPIQLTATSLSGRSVTTFSATGLPTGLSISTIGLISGTASSVGVVTATITATTGFASSSANFTFTVISDNLIVVMANTTETVPITFSGVEFRALTYSGKEGVLDTSLTDLRAPWQSSIFNVSFANGTFLQGDFSTLPAVLPKYRFGVRGTAGSYLAISPVDVNVNNAPTFVRNMIGLVTITSPIPPIPPNTNGVPPLGLVGMSRSTGPAVQLIDQFSYNYSAAPLTWLSVAPFPISNVVYGIYDMAQSSNVYVAVVGSNMYRSVDSGETWGQIPSSNIQAIDVSGGPAFNFSTPYFPPHPLFGCIATDGNSNWVTIAIGTGVNGGSTPYNIIRNSVDNGATWADTSTNLFVDVNLNTKLFYNNSRYFVLAGIDTATNPILYADSTNLQTWTVPIGPTGVMNDMAFSNDTLLIVGSNTAPFPAISACYTSTNNGTTWSPLPSDPIPYSNAAAILSAKYAYGKWAVSGRDSIGRGAVSFSSNLTTWALQRVAAGTISVSAEDGAAWLFGGIAGGNTGIWDSAGDVTVGGGNWSGQSTVGFTNKRLLTNTVSNGTPTLTLSIPYDPSGLAFVDPVKTSYINWQFVPISPISVEAQPTSPGFVYYYASGLPDGLVFTPSADGSNATITGTSVTFSDTPQRVLLFSAIGLSVLPRIISMRTILPTVQRQQDGAGAWTSLVRQYTEVNAATTARDSKATPSNQYRLGEFTSPTPPSVTTAQSNCLC